MLQGSRAHVSAAAAAAAVVVVVAVVVSFGLLVLPYRL